jgi:hypothetical protein
MRKIIASFILLGFLSSCVDLEDRLYDKIPADQFPENETQAALMMIPLYKPLQDHLDWGGWWFAQEVPSDEMTCPTRLTDWDDGGKWRVLHQHTWDNETEAVSSMWSRFYRGITEANKLIEFLEPSRNTDAGVASIAKAVIMRSYYYYLLIDNYGDVPYVTTFATAEEYPSKVARAEIFQAIVSDVEEHIQYLGASTSKTSVTKGMAFSLLAKLYLNAQIYSGTAQWAKAEAATDSVIALGAYSLEAEPLAPFITENENSIENIFTIPYDEDTYKGFNLHMRTLHYQSNLTYNMSVGPWNGFATVEAHYNSYEAADLRKAGFLVGQQYDANGAKISDGVTGTPLIINPVIPALNMGATYTLDEVRMSGARVVKFQVKKAAKDNLSNDFPIFRYADILLMKAEAMIRQGKNGDEYVNMIRARAGVSDFTNTTLVQLLAERGREMFWEAHRRQDQIRFGTFNNAWWEKQASSPTRNTFPIPKWVLDANPNLN